MKKKILALLLSLTMLLGFAPSIPVLAADDLEGGSETGETDGNPDGDLGGDLDGDLDGEGGNDNICYVSIVLIDYDTGDNICVENNPIAVQLTKTSETFYTGKAGDVNLEVTKGQEIRMPANFVEGYCLVGYTDEIEPFGTIQEEYNATFIFEDGEGVIYALFQKSTDVTVTFHWSSLENTDIMSPKEVTVPTGVSLETAILKTDARIESGTGEYLIFEKEGYKQCILTKAALTSYKSYDEIWNAAGGSNTHWYGEVIRGNTDVYVCMLKPIDKVTLGSSIPFVAKSVTVAPVITIKDDPIHYSVESAGWATETGESIEETVFEEGKKYTASVLLTADMGYYFIDQSSLSFTAVPSDSYSCKNAGECHLIVDIVCLSENEHGYACIDGDKQIITQDSNTPLSVRFDYSEASSDNICAHVTGVGVANASGTISDNFERNNNRLFWKMPEMDGSFRKNLEGLVQPEGMPQTCLIGDLNSGSVIVNLYPEYIDTLTAGEYTLTVYFDDGNSISSTFTVVAAAAATATPTPTLVPTSTTAPTPASDANKAGTSVPSTGEGISNTMVWGAVIVSIAVIGASVIINRKKQCKKDTK